MLESRRNVDEAFISYVAITFGTAAPQIPRRKKKKKKMFLFSFSYGK